MMMILLSTMQKSNEDLLGLVNALLEVYKYDAEKDEMSATFGNPEYAYTTKRLVFGGSICVRFAELWILKALPLIKI